MQIAEGATLSVKNNGVASQAIGGILNSNNEDNILLGFDLNNTNVAVGTPMINVDDGLGAGTANINATTIINISNVNSIRYFSLRCFNNLHSKLLLRLGMLMEDLSAFCRF